MEECWVLSQAWQSSPDSYGQIAEMDAVWLPVALEVAGRPQKKARSTQARRFRQAQAQRSVHLAGNNQFAHIVAALRSAPAYVVPLPPSHGWLA